MHGLPAEKDGARQLLSSNPVDVEAIEWTDLPDQFQFGKGRSNCEARLVAYRDERQSDIRTEIGAQK